MTLHGIAPLRTSTAADRLELLARRPLQPRRTSLRRLAQRLRVLEALDHDHARDHDQLSLERAA